MMRAAVMAAVLVVAACRSSSSGAAQGFDGGLALRRVERQVAAGPRVPGTAAHRAIGDWIEAELRRRADTVEVQRWTHVTVAGDTLPLRNVIARFQPANPNRVLFLTHWDSRPRSDMDPDPARRSQPVPGANDGASGVAVLLGVADALRRAPPALGVDLLFVDGEDYGSFDGDAPDVLLGSRHFASTLPPSYRPLFAVLLDMVGGSGQEYEQESYSLDNAPEVVERVWTTAEEIGLGRVFRARRGTAVTDDHIPLLRAGIRAIDVIGFPWEFWHTTADTPDKLSAESLQNVGRLVLALVR